METSTIEEVSDQVRPYALHRKRIERRFILEDQLKSRRSIEEIQDFQRHIIDRQFKLIVDVFAWEPIATKRTRDVATWPDGWWQALKEQHAPRWFLRRWPVRRREKVFEHTLSAHIVVPSVFEDKDVVFLYEFDGDPLVVELEGREPK